MTTSYNQIASQSAERLAALRGRIFAVAMTPLVLGLGVPAASAAHSERELWRALCLLSLRLLIYMMSFLTLGIFGVGQKTQLNYLARSHRSRAWIHILFLFAVALTPFSTKLLADSPTYRAAFLAYWMNILLLGVSLHLSWNCATDLGLPQTDMPAGVPPAIKQRIVVTQGLHAFGAIFSVFGTYISIAFIVLGQPNYAIAPQLWRRS